MAGTTGLEPATSAVTANWKSVTHWNQGERMAIFGALRHSEELLLDPYWTHDLCPANLCPDGYEAGNWNMAPVLESMTTIPAARYLSQPSK
jgi:hypothetical protein